MIDPRGDWDEPILGETSADWAAFRCYRDLPPVERSVPEVARLLALDDICTLRNTARAMHWESRALAYDQHLDQVRLARVERALERRADLDTERLEIGSLLLDAGRRRAENLTRDPNQMTPRDLVRIVELALGLLSGSGSGPRDENIDLSNVSDEDLRAIERVARAAQLAERE